MQINGIKVIVKDSDMSQQMQKQAIYIANIALVYPMEKDIATYIKKQFDKTYGPIWHCIVGRNFGHFVTHQSKHFIHFYLGQASILLFKTS